MALDFAGAFCGLVFEFVADAVVFLAFEMGIDLFSDCKLDFGRRRSLRVVTVSGVHVDVDFIAARIDSASAW